MKYRYRLKANDVHDTRSIQGVKLSKEWKEFDSRKEFGAHNNLVEMETVGDDAPSLEEQQQETNAPVFPKTIPDEVLAQSISGLPELESYQGMPGAEDFLVQIKKKTKTKLREMITDSEFSDTVLNVLKKDGLLRVVMAQQDFTQQESLDVPAPEPEPEPQTEPEPDQEPEDGGGE